jgi:predicted KAP-like P-loop ATPase
VKVWRKTQIFKRSKTYNLLPKIYTIIKEREQIPLEVLFSLFPTQQTNIIKKILKKLEKDGEVILTSKYVKMKKVGERLEL